MLVRPRLFNDDAWENLFEENEKFCCQCWTLETASDAMWRIYSRGSDAIRIKSTVRKLVESLCHALPNRDRDVVFAGKVHYIRDFEIKAFATRIRRSKPVIPRVMAETLLVKRLCFKHESEVRLLCFLPDDPWRDRHPYRIDPHKLVTQIMVDPRMSPSKADDFKKWIGKWTGFKENFSGRSSIVGQSGHLRRRMTNTRLGPPEFVSCSSLMLR